MFVVNYRERIMLDGFRARDVEKSFRCKRIEFVGGIAYCYRSEFAYVTLTADQVEAIFDLRVPGLDICVGESFRTGKIEYMMVI